LHSAIAIGVSAGEIRQQDSAAVEACISTMSFFAHPISVFLPSLANWNRFTVSEINFARETQCTGIASREVSCAAASSFFQKQQ
jgi:hypothetical protein